MDSCLTDALFAQEIQPVEVAIAGFGDRFELLDEGMTTSDEVRRALVIFTMTTQPPIFPDVWLKPCVIQRKLL